MSDTSSEKPAGEIAWTPRQREVLDLIARGRTNGEIAAELGVSLAGAKWHVSEVLSKLGVGSREEAAAYWRGERGPARRARRALRAMLGLPAAWTATAAGALGVAAVASFAVLGGPPNDADSAVGAEAPADTRAANGVQDFTTEEATELAYRLAQDYLGTTGRPGEPTMAEKSPIDGRPLRVTDMILRERRFEPLVQEAAFTTVASAWGGHEPTDIWMFHFHLGPFLHAGAGPNDLDVEVVFFDGTGKLSAAGAGGTAVTPQPDMDLADAVPRIGLIDDGNGNRATLSVYGPPDEPCLRLDQTGPPPSTESWCPLDANLDPLLALAESGGGLWGATTPEVARLAIERDVGQATDLPLVDGPGPYAGRLRLFLAHGGGGGTLVAWSADGRLLGRWPLSKRPSQPAASVDSVGFFEQAGVGNGATPEFDVPDAARRYGFVLEYPEDGGHLTVTAACDAGSSVVLDADAPLPPPLTSMVVTFPRGATRCHLAVEAPAGVPWAIRVK